MIAIKRGVAFAIDCYIISIVIIFATLFLGILVNIYPIEIKNFNLLITIICLMLFVFKDILFKRSFGKMIMKLKIIKESSTKNPSFISLILRNITVLIFPIELIFYIIKYQENIKLGDLLAKTKVVEK